MSFNSENNIHAYFIKYIFGSTYVYKDIHHHLPLCHILYFDFSVSTNSLSLMYLRHLYFHLMLSYAISTSRNHNVYALSNKFWIKYFFAVWEVFFNLLLLVSLLLFFLPCIFYNHLFLFYQALTLTPFFFLLFLFRLSIIFSCLCICNFRYAIVSLCCTLLVFYTSFFVL